MPTRFPEMCTLHSWRQLDRLVTVDKLRQFNVRRATNACSKSPKRVSALAL
jgi:hypothetical protein